MTATVVHSDAFASVPSRFGRWAALLKRSLRRAMIAADTRRALNDLPDDLLRDVGVTRGEIDFVAQALASGHGDSTRDATDRLNWRVADRGTAATRASAGRA